MSQRPPILAKLKRGTLITQTEHLTDTLNWIIDFCNSLRGEADDDPSASGIKVDRSVSDRPLLKLCNVTGGGMDTVGGNDESSTEVTLQDGAKKILFRSAEDSNVRFNVSNDDEGNIVVTVGVYYV